MHVAINATALRANRSGVGWFISEVLRHLPDSAEGQTYSIFFNKAFVDREPFANPSVQMYSSAIATDRLYSRLLWENAQLPSLIRQLRPDVFHGNAFALPLANLGIPTVVTVYDLIHRVLPDSQTWIFRQYLDYIVPHSCLRATRVIAISEATRRDLIEVYGIPPEKIDLTYGGVAPRFFAEPDEETLRSVRQKYALPDAFALTIGDLDPRKNLLTAIRACGALERDSLSLPLVLAGKEISDSHSQELEAEVERLGLKDKVIFTGRLEDDELPVFYRAATLFLFPSHYEGFGLPAVEAMASGTPVVASTGGSLPEVVGDAGVVVPPDDVEGFATAIHRIYSDPSFHDELVAKGHSRAAEFTWENTARQTAQVYERAVAEFREQ
jgi:glycosyltransferase involved in cell wall biosynthesis